MKRYQCIKNYDVNPIGSKPIRFRAGIVYPMDIYGHFIDDYGRSVRFVESGLREHFQELLDLNVDEPNESYQDHDAAEYDRFLSGLPTTRGCAIAVAISIALIAIIILTWNS